MLKLKLIVVLTAFIALHGYAQPKENLPIPLDSHVRYGKLKNGFTYYIRNNGQPLIAISMTIKAGWAHEEKDQFGLAHLLEHVIMNAGTTHTPAGGLAAFVMKEGLVGYNYGAGTGTSSTVYNWTIPATRPELLSKSLLMLHDFAYDEVVAKNLKDPKVVDNERLTVLEEFMGHDRNYQNKTYRLLGEPKGHRAYDPTISEDAHNAYIKIFPIEQLSRFYKEWYRPDRQAVIIVGNVDAEKLEQQVKDMFSDLKNPVSLRLKNMEHYLKDYAISLNGRNQVITLTGKDITALELEIYMKHLALGSSGAFFNTVDYRTKIIRQLFVKMIRPRLSSLTQKYRPPLQEANSIFRPVGGIHTEIEAIYTNIKGSSRTTIRQALQDVLIELERVKRNGFSLPELEKAKSDVLKEAQKRRPNSSAMAGAYQSHFLYGAAAPSPEYELELVTRLINAISLDEANQTFRDLINSESNMDIIINAPEKDNDSLPSEKELMKWIAEVKSAELEPYKDGGIIKPLMTPEQLRKLSKNQKYKATEVREVGITKWKLANGIQFILKPFKTTHIQEDEVLLRGYSTGGYSQYSKKDHFSAAAASEIIHNSGVGGLDKFELAASLEDKKVYVYPNIRYESEGIDGSSSLKDLESMLQLVYQYFVSPNKNENAFIDWMTNQKTDLEKRKGWTQAKFFASIETLTKENSGRHTFETLKKIRLDKAWQIYRERFANASDFTFVITGNFELEKIKPLLFRYLGSLPVIQRKEVILKPEISKPKTGINHTTYSGQEEMDLPVMLSFAGNYDFNTKNNLILDVLGIIVRNVSFKRLVEKEGVYYNTAGVRYQRNPDQRYTVKLDFRTDAKGVERRIGAALEEMAKLGENGPDEDIFRGAIIEKKRKLENNLNSAQFWLDYLVEQHQNRDDLTAILQQSAILDKIKKEDIKVAAQQYLNIKNLNRFVMLPESENPNNTTSTNSEQKQ